MSAPEFDQDFRARLAELIAWRRDVRRFSTRPVAPALVETLLDLAQLSPSVGISQPWRWVEVRGAGKRAEMRENFRQCNAAAGQAQNGGRAELYASLKLAGMDRAPVQFAVFCDHGTGQGHGLGRHTMPEMLDHSTVAMITTFWLAARAEGLGLGWVSILDPVFAAAALGVPASWKFIAYLCLGWPEEEHLDPELVRFDWQQRSGAGREVKIV